MASRFKGLVDGASLVDAQGESTTRQSVEASPAPLTDVWNPVPDDAAPPCGSKPQSAGPVHSTAWPPSCDNSGEPIDPASPPPSYCVAPCLWEVIKQCLPKGPCSSHDRIDVYGYFAGHSGYTVCVAGRVCMSFGRGSVPPSDFMPIWGWTDSKDEAVASGGGADQHIPTATHCGSSCYPDNPVPALDDSGACEGTSYSVAVEQPECRQWRWVYGL